MKKIIAALSLIMAISAGQAQTWSTSLNSGSGLKFGLSSNHPFSFYTNSLVRMTLDANGHLSLADLAGTGSRLVKTDANGQLVPFAAGTNSQVLYGDGSWGSLPAVLSNLGTTGAGASLKVYSTAPYFGVGLSNPASPLDVIGDIHTSTILKANNGMALGTTGQLQIAYISPGGGNPGVLNFGSSLSVSDVPNLLCGASPLSDNGAQLFGFFGHITMPSSLAGTGPKLNLTSTSLGASIYSKSGDLYLNNCNENVNICSGTSGNVGVGMIANATTRMGVRGDNISKAFSILDFNTNLSGDEKLVMLGSGQTFLGPKVQQNNGAILTVGQAVKTDLALCLTDNTTTSNKHFLNVYGSGQTFVGPDLQQTTGAMFTIGQAAKSSLALSLTDNTNAVANKPFYNVYGNGQTFIGADVQQTTGAMFTVGQATKGALALSLTDNTNAGSNQSFFNVYGNGFTEIKVYSPSAMPGNRVFVIKDMAASKDLFVVKKDGKVYAREVEISLVTSFPDYVFDKSYKLRSIPEVAAFVDQNKHLPGFEKGEYYEKNGMNVSELMIKQQEKLEEQMLYIIQLEKRLQALEAKK